MNIHFNHTEPVEAPAEVLFDVLTDYASYPSFDSALIKGCAPSDRRAGEVARSDPLVTLLVEPRPVAIQNHRRVGAFGERPVGAALVGAQARVRERVGDLRRRVPREQ